MTKKLGPVLAIAFTIVYGIVSSAHAGECNYLGRLIGIGWSDGYHAEDVRYAQQGNFNYGPSTIPSAGYSAPPGVYAAPPRGYNVPTPAYAPRPAAPVPLQRPMMVPNPGYMQNSYPQGMPNYAPPMSVRNW